MSDPIEEGLLLAPKFDADGLVTCVVTDAGTGELLMVAHMNAQVATAIDEILKPRGVAVMIEAEHTCMSLRGVEKPGALTVTTQFRGAFRDDSNEQLRFISMVRGSQR